MGGLKKKKDLEIFKSITHFSLIHMDIPLRQISSNAKKLKWKSNRHIGNKADIKKPNHKLIQRWLQCSRNIVSICLVSYSSGNDPAAASLSPLLRDVVRVLLLISGGQESPTNWQLFASPVTYFDKWTSCRNKSV